MPAARKYPIPHEILEQVAAKQIGCTEVARMFGCTDSAVRSQAQALTRSSVADRSRMIDPGIGGDLEFDRRMGEQRFTDCRRAIRDKGSPEKLQPPAQYASYSGSSFELCAAT